MDAGEILVLLFIVVLLFVLITHGYAGIIGAPWVPTKAKDINRIIEVVGSCRTRTIIDLGCGGGRIMRAFSHAFPGSFVIGYELSVPVYIIAVILNFFLLKHSSYRVLWRDFYRANFNNVDVIYCFLMPHALKKLEPKFREELGSGSIVISYAFPLPGWRGEEYRIPGKLPIYRYMGSCKPALLSEDKGDAGVGVIDRGNNV